MRERSAGVLPAANGKGSGLSRSCYADNEGAIREASSPSSCVVGFRLALINVGASGERPLKKSQWGALKGRWVPHDTHDEIVDYVRHWTDRAELPARKLLGWLGLSTSKYHQWRERYGRPNEHNGDVPRDGWLTDEEKQAIVDYHDRHPREGYRCLTCMMLDDDVAAVSAASVYRELKAAGRLDRRSWAKSKKGTGFVQPLQPHEHWHVDISHLNIGGTFYYLCSLLDGYSRAIVHWEIRETMKEQDVETITQRALEKYPGEKPRIISDNGPQFIAKEFKQFVRACGLTHVRND